jgi:AcrR family transcriptional regulator
MRRPDPATPPARRGRPRSPDVERKVRAAAKALLVEVGYDGTTVEAVAARAGVAKTAIYRRWSSKATMIYETLLTGDPTAFGIPDTGDVRADLLQVLQQNASGLRDRTANTLVNRLLAEAAADQALADAFRASYFEPRAELIAQRVRVAVERGELADSVDADLVPALLTGPLQYLVLVRGSRLTPHDLGRVVDAVIGPHLLPRP